MKKRGALMFLSVLMLAIALGPLAAAEEAAKDAPKATYDPHSRPPKNLHQMPDGHWTPWDPPMPPEGSRVHVVTKGDTLWGLGQQYLNNPYLWPQIWDQNRYVLDSHWIYPGDALVIPSPEVVPAEPPQSPTAETEQPSRGGEGVKQAEAPAPPPKPRIFPLGDYQDAYCVAFVQEGPVVAPAIVAPDEDDLQGIAQGHVVYVNAGSAEGLNPGDKFTIVRDSGDLRHPVTKAKLGHRIDWRGQLTLIAVQEHTATAEVTFSCEDIRRGDMILPFKEVSIPTRTARLNSNLQNRYTNMGSGKTSGFVILSRDEQIALGQGNIVGVDMGPSDVQPGDMLTIYRDNLSAPGVLPRQNLGEAVVLRTEGQSAIVRISAAVKEIYVGDRAEVR
jgi:hypothetical protein